MSVISISVPLAGAKSKLAELVDRVSRGEEFVITRHGTEIARLIPAQRPRRAAMGAVIARMRAGRAGRNASTSELIIWKQEGGR